MYYSFCAWFHLLVTFFLFAGVSQMAHGSTSVAKWH